MSRNPSTNVEKVTDFMNFSENGAMSQLFVMEAIGRYAKMLDEVSDEAIKVMDEKGSIISMAALQKTAREWLTNYDSK